MVRKAPRVRITDDPKPKRQSAEEFVSNHKSLKSKRCSVCLFIQSDKWIEENWKKLVAMRKSDGSRMIGYSILYQWLTGECFTGSSGIVAHHMRSVRCAERGLT